jgi:hypothetical protein
MDSFFLYPLTLLRKNIAAVLIPSIPILFLVAYLVMSGGSDPDLLLERTDDYLGGTIYLSAANLTAYNDISTNVQMPIIRVGGIADKTDIRELLDGSDPANFLLVFSILFFAFISYAMLSRAIYNLKATGHGSMGLEGINPAAIILSLLAVFLMVFISSFSLGGFKLLLMVSFGIYFTFSIPYAAAGEPLGESIFKAFGMLQKIGKVIAAYVSSMGIAIMMPIGLLLFTTPLILNLESPTVQTLLKLSLGLLSVVLALFYQMAMCATVAYEE